MDNTIDMTDLEEALSKMANPGLTIQPTDIPIYTPTNQLTNSTLNTMPKSNTKAKVSNSSNLSTGVLLHNLAGLTNITHNKLDILIDSSMRLQQAMQNILAEQSRQTELLGIIARNTANSSPSTPTMSKQIVDNGMNIKQLGFNDTKHLITDLILKVIKEAEKKIIERGKQYRSSRALKDNMMNAAVRIACKEDFKIDGEVRSVIKLPESKSPMVLKLARRLGSIDGIAPVLNPTTLKELFEDTDVRALMSIVQDIMERLSIIKIIIPFYEGDIIKSIYYPYFDKDGELLCHWDKIVPRQETPEEALVMNATATIREKIAKMLAKGASMKATLRVCIKE